jgi:ankyrin repeat protein
MNIRNYENVVECMKLLLEHGCSLNTPNNALRTPFYLILKKRQEIEEISDFVFDIMNTYEIDFHTYKGQEVAEMINRFYPNFNIPMKKVTPDFDFIMKLLDNRKEVDFEIYFYAFKELAGSKYQDSCIRFLEVAVGNGMRDTVEFLIEKRVDVNARSPLAKYLKPPAFIACANGYFRILELLLKRNELNFYHENGTQKYSLLHEVCQNYFIQKGLRSNSNVDYQKCFDMILKDVRCDPNVEDDMGCSPLHYTVRYKNDLTTISLLKKGAYINEESNFGKTPIDEISYATLEKFLDDCITTNSKTEKRIPDVQIDYTFLIAPNRNRDNDSADKDGFCREISALKRIADNEELRNLVNHPVLSSFLFLKWSKLSFLFYLNLGFFVMFMLAFVIFIVMSQAYTTEQSKESQIFHIFKFISFFSILMLMIREIFQCALSFTHYFRSLINWFEILLIILSWTVYITIEQDDDPSDKKMRYLRSVLILFATFECFQIVGSLPFLSVSTHMVILKRVSITFFKSIALYSILPLSFGLVFFMIFHVTNPDSDTDMPSNKTDCGEKPETDFASFSSPGWSIVRTFVMLTGEFDASDIGELNNVFVCIIFILFVFVCTIVLFNLLNALAVSDTQAIKAKGEIIDLIQRIEVLDSYERIIFNRESKMNSKLGPWLRSFISLFPNTIPNGKIIIRPSRNNEILTFKSSDLGKLENKSFGDMEISTPTRSFRRVTINEKLLLKLQKYSYMSTSIMKRVRNILIMKEERKAQEQIDRQVRDDIASIKNQMELQLRLINELLSKQLTK